jgi:hypothetical protein
MVVLADRGGPRRHDASSRALDDRLRDSELVRFGREREVEPMKVLVTGGIECAVFERPSSIREFDVGIDMLPHAETPRLAAHR